MQVKFVYFIFASHPLFQKASSYDNSSSRKKRDNHHHTCMISRLCFADHSKRRISGSSCLIRTGFCCHPCLGLSEQSRPSTGEYIHCQVYWFIARCQYARKLDQPYPTSRCTANILCQLPFFALGDNKKAPDQTPRHCFLWQVSYSKSLTKVQKEIRFNVKE